MAMVSAVFGQVKCGARRCEDHHEGRPQVGRVPGRDLIVVSCPEGHVYDSIDRNDWAQSPLESKVTDPNWTVVCHGALGG